MDDLPLILSRPVASDIDHLETFELLLEVTAINPYFKPFSEIDLQCLAKVLVVLKFTKGETIIQNGETASFFGVVLKGSLKALINNRKIQDIDKGQLVGEMSLFTGGVRNADIIANTDGVLATMTFEQFREISEFEPKLALKLMETFATSSVSSLKITKEEKKAEMNQQGHEALYRTRLQNASSEINEAELKLRQEQARNRAVMTKTAEDSIRKLQRHINEVETKVFVFSRLN